MSHDPPVAPAQRGPRSERPTGFEADEALDVVLVGGGLQNSLIALGLAERHPEASFALVEQHDRLGGNHTWCFHAADIPPAASPWVAPLVIRRWSSHEVRFPGHQRVLNEPYCAVSSERLHEVVSHRLNSLPHARRVTARAEEIGHNAVTLSDGRQLHAKLVVDARGPHKPTDGSGCGYQKFLGLEVRVAPGTAPVHPILMDATVAQRDGFRFVYVLPLTADRLLIEDTYYSDTPILHCDDLRQQIRQYAARKGFDILETLREETGVLPIPLHRQAMTSPRQSSDPQGPLLAGYGGGMFHPTTGYSFPAAARFAEVLTGTALGQSLAEPLGRLLSDCQRQQRFCLLLNRLLFGAFQPEERFEVLSRFYKLPAATIRRFYAMQTSGFDRARILCGRPPKGFSLRRLVAQGDLS